MPIDDSASDYPADIRALLERLGVNVDFWAHRFCEPEENGGPNLTESEFDSDELREIKRGLRRRLIDTADEVGREAHGWGDGEEELLIPLLLEGGSPDLIPALAVLIGDKLARDGDETKAMAMYRQAVDLAPTAQAQMEVGYLLAQRGQVTFPVNFVPWYTEPMLLTSWEYTGELWPFPGLDHYQVIFEELLPGPELQYPTPALRLALEAYGRVFARCFPPGEKGSSLDRGLSPRMSFDALVIDGLHVLLSALDSHDAALADACIQTVYEWSGGGFGRWVEDRLRVSLIYLQGRREGREDAEVVQQGVEIARRAVVMDPDAFLQTMREEIRSELGAMPTRRRGDLEDFFRDRFSGWGEFPSGVREPLLVGEKEFLEKGGQVGQDFAGTVIYYGRAAEAALRFVSESRRASLGEFSTGDSARSLLRARLKPAAPLDWLVSTLGEIAGSMRNQAAHGSVEHRAFSESECDRCRTKVLEVIECLMKYRVRSG